MRIFLAGATGAIGRRLVPMLLSAGHTVTGMTRTPDKAESLRRAGADPAVADAFDSDSLKSAVESARPDIVVHQLTALSSFSDLRDFERSFAKTNRLRTEGTRNLIAAARAAGARRFIAQSYCAWPYARIGGPVKSETDPLDPDPPKPVRSTIEAIRDLERQVTVLTGMEGLVLRYGAFYGPGTSIAKGEPYIEAIRKRQFPLVGGGTGVWSFIHIDDAASATTAAIERGAPGIYNIADDEPAPVSEWLPFLAATLGAKPPWRFPAWLARFFVGEAGVTMMTEIRGASNAKAKRELHWQPEYASWRDGFRRGLG